MKEILDIIHKTIYQFFDVCEDDEEVPISEKDELLLEVDKAICNNLKALEQQPCEDCISKTELLARIDAERKHLIDIKMDGAEHIVVHHARRIIEDMPSVTPQQPCEDLEREYEKSKALFYKVVAEDDCISRKEALSHVEDLGICNGVSEGTISRLPSVTPTRPKGKWIDKGIGRDEMYAEIFVCSECGSYGFYDNFCPNCGADMRGDADDED